jgi:transposase
MRYELTDSEWAASKPMLPNKPRGVPRVNDRRVLNGIFWVLRSGAPWRDLPQEFGPYTTCYNRFVRWRRARGKIFVLPALQCRQAAGSSSCRAFIASAKIEETVDLSRHAFQKISNIVKTVVGVNQRRRLGFLPRLKFDRR